MGVPITESGEHISPCWSCYSGIIAERGEGSQIYADDGGGYPDFTSGIGVTSTGHCLPGW